MATDISRFRAALEAAQARLTRCQHDYLIACGWRYASDGESCGWCRPGKRGHVLSATEAIEAQHAKPRPITGSVLRRSKQEQPRV